MKQLWEKKKQRRGNRKQGILDNKELDQEIEDTKQEICHLTSETRIRELEEKIHELEKNGGAKSNNVWKIRKSIKMGPNGKVTLSNIQMLGYEQPLQEQSGQLMENTS